MRPEDIIKAIEMLANPALQASWDKSGLQVATMRQRITRVGVMLDALPESLQIAMDDKAEFIISHHPLALKPELPTRHDNYYKVLKLLMRSDIGLYAAHTSLDVNQNGPAGWLGRSLRLKNLEVLEKIPGFENDMTGYGEVGDLPAPCAADELLGTVMELIAADFYTICGSPLPEQIKRIAICGGSGSSLAERAAEENADLYITGDIRYHAALETPVPILDAGHHAIEEEMMRLFAADLQSLLPQVDVKFYASRSPFHLLKNISGQ